MKSIISAILIAMISISGPTFAQYLVNAGSNIVITSGSSVVINGDFINQLDGAVNNSGTMRLTGDWINNQTSGNLLNGTTGSVQLLGSTPQDIGGSAITYFHNLELQNDANLTANAISVNGDLILSNTYLSLGSGVVVVQPTGQILGAGPSGYIIAGGSGLLRQYVTGANRVFPVGTISNFVPVTLSNAGTADYYSVRVIPDVRVNGTTGATLPNINDCVNMTWVISENVLGGSNLNVTPYWGAGLEGASFDRTHCAVGRYASSWDPNPEGPASGSGPYSISRTGITGPLSSNAFAVGDLESPMAIPVDIRLDLAAFLEGPFNGSGMDTDLNNLGLIPLAQPYNVAPWFYGGSESVVSVPPNAVDWVLLELRDATSAATATAATTVAMKAAFVLNDGSIVDLDGSTLPSFSFTLTNQLFAIVWHRNHLGIMSANALTPSGGIYSYDFTTAAGQAYLAGQKNLGGGNYGLYAGNADGDNGVDASDYALWKNHPGEGNVYDPTDFDLNAQINNQDKDDFLYFNFGTTSTIP